MEELRKKPVIIDTDPGDDDAASIMWVLASHKFDVRAITVTNGNVGVEWCVINALRTLEVCKRQDIPVYRGAYRPLVRPSIDASWIHGRDGFGDHGFPMPSIRAGEGYAAAQLARIAKESKEPVTILALGPLTNIAMAILLDPDFENHVKEVLFMGGTFKVSGNQSPRASYNVMVDPEAAKVVYHSRIPVVQLGLDVCDKVTQRESDLEEIKKAGTKAAEFLGILLSSRLNQVTKPVYDKQGNKVGELKLEDQGGRHKGEIGLNDLTATGYLINPEWFRTEHVFIDVENHGLCDGETIVDYMGLWGREPNNYFACEVDGDALVSQWVADMKAGFK
ncbi:nucleoside hydrolase [Enterocloster aldenensis]|uniref:nucleoside hydrolase n=1 Tax=Enterocloster aldenensis TaxID=358742 RepID=UPI0040266CDA